MGFSEEAKKQQQTGVRSTSSHYNIIFNNLQDAKDQDDVAIGDKMDQDEQIPPLTDEEEEISPFASMKMGKGAVVKPNKKMQQPTLGKFKSMEGLQRKKSFEVGTPKSFL